MNKEKQSIRSEKNFVELFCETLAAIPYVTFYNWPPKSKRNKS